MRWLPTKCKDLSPRPALVEVSDKGTRRWTYGAAGDVICRVASFLQSTVPPQSRVLLAVTEGGEWPLFSLGILLSGNILIPCDIDDAPTRLAGMIADAAPDLVIADTKQAEHILNVTSMRLRVSCLDEILRTPFPKDLLGQDPSFDSISHIFFTSGSTGRPKGCVCTTENLALYVDSSIAVRQIDQESVIFVASAATFDPSLGDFVTAVRAGACMVVPPRNCVGDNLASLIEEMGCTHLQTTPSTLSTIASQPSSSLRSLFLGGEVTPQSLVEHWQSVRLFLHHVWSYGVLRVPVSAPCRWATKSGCSFSQRTVRGRWGGRLRPGPPSGRWKAGGIMDCRTASWTGLHRRQRFPSAELPRNACLSDWGCRPAVPGSGLHGSTRRADKGQRQTGGAHRD
mmetsp:Transcript_3024/g.5979  ORF Transcript_3024/g.5979 Transcript_3024/m.5979 type:complete len:398 (+) Transcript_3024:16-1209(+)